MAEAVQLAALDTEFYNRTFFPNTFRQATPPFHRDVYQALESRKRLLALKIFRGGAKTTIFRSFASKRIAYGTSRTIVFVGKSQDHSLRSVAWIKRAVEYNKIWSSVFGLEPGSIWKEEMIQIMHKVLGHPITVLATGITGNVRGINIDDYRPDLIVVDDPCHEYGTLVEYQGTWIPVQLHPGARSAKWAPGIEVKLDGLPEPEVVTVDHKYWAALPTYSYASGNKKVVGLLPAQWVEASKLTREHYIGMPLADNSILPTELPEMAKPEFWYLVGLWWGDGDLSGNGCTVRWSISSARVERKAREAALALGWLTQNQLSEAACFRLAVGNSKLWRWLATWKRGNSMKLAPSCVDTLPQWELFQLVQGYVDADGCPNVERTGVRLSSKYLPGLVQVTRLLGRLGVRSTIRKSRKAGTSIIDGREVFGEQQYELGFTEQADKFLPGLQQPKRIFQKCLLVAGNIWRRVESATPTATERAFVPVSTEEHTYITAFGLSHNCDEENTATPEQREKIADRFFGALLQSLAPASESPEAKQVLLQTPLNPQDLISSCEKDPAWTTATYGILDEAGKSRWPSRWSTQEVLEERQSYVDRGQLPLWTREKQCTIIAKELSDFKDEWIRYWTVLPPQMPCFLWIDPVPPPSAKELETGLKKKDQEALAVVGIYQGNFYLLDYKAMKGHDPEWTIKTFFELYRRWRFVRGGVEGVAYQRTLKWILDKAMQRERTYVQVDAITDKRSKRHRILQSLSGPCSQGRFYCHNSHVEFLQQYLAYPNVAHDDILEAVAGAVKLASDSRMESGQSSSEDDTKPLPQTWRSAP